MALRRILHPSNRGVRVLVGTLLVGLFCIQCIDSGQSEPSGTAIAAPTPLETPEDAATRLTRLAENDPIALLEQCQASYDRNVRDYTCTLIKQERINGQLKAEQEIDVKFLDDPFSVAMTWTRNAPLGDRILYVEGKYDDKMIVRPKSGLFQMLTGGSVRRRPDGPDAMKNTLRPVNLFGFKRGMRELIKVYRDARERGEMETSFNGFAELHGRKVLVLERILPPREDYPAWKTIVYVDPEMMVPVGIEGYDWDERLICRYIYKDVRFNVGLTEDDFLPRANGIAGQGD